MPLVRNLLVPYGITYLSCEWNFSTGSFFVHPSRTKSSSCLYLYLYIFIYIYFKIYSETIENGYDGCWKDTIAERLLQHEIGRGVQNIQECALRCLGYRYFGMEVNTMTYLLELNIIVIMSTE